MKLKKQFETLLTIICVMLTLFIVCIDDFDLRAIPILLFIIAVDLFLIWVLKKYGRGIFFEEDEKYENNK